MDPRSRQGLVLWPKQHSPRYHQRPPGPSYLGNTHRQLPRLQHVPVLYRKLQHFHKHLLWRLVRCRLCLELCWIRWSDRVLCFKDWIRNMFRLCPQQGFRLYRGLLGGKSYSHLDPCFQGSTVADDLRFRTSSTSTHLHRRSTKHGRPASSA